MKKEKTLLDIHIENISTVGTFWMEEFKGTLIHMILSAYSTDVIREYTITDIVIRDNVKFESTDKVLIKWAKRYQPLSDEELKEKFGR